MENSEKLTTQDEERKRQKHVSDTTTRV